MTGEFAIVVSFVARELVASTTLAGKHHRGDVLKTLVARVNKNGPRLFAFVSVLLEKRSNLLFV